MFNKFSSSFFKGSLEKSGIYKQVAASQYVAIAQDVLKQRFGEGALKHAKPVSIKNRTLYIAIAHPAIAEHIRMKEETIISEMNAQIGYAEIIRIQFVLPKNEEPVE
jgi:hypothetical protein